MAVASRSPLTGRSGQVMIANQSGAARRTGVQLGPGVPRLIARARGHGSIIAHHESRCLYALQRGGSY